jgi:phosphocarrier protein FPr
MVGIVIVSHSRGIAEGVVELAREMGGPEVLLEAAGGLDLAGHPIGTDAVLVVAAVERAWSEDGVLVLMDLGSAVLSAEMAVEMLPEERRSRVLLCEAPLVEGAVAAAVTAKLGATLGRVAQEARGGLAGKIAHLGGPGEGATEPRAETSNTDAVATGPQAMFRFRLDLPHGLHARPAARFVETASSFDAHVTARDLTNGRGPADARSLNAVAMLGATYDHEIEALATGREAGAAIEALRALVARRFDERTHVPEPPIVPGPAPASTDASILRGRSASPGIAFGPARRFHVVELSVPDEPGGDPDEELATLAAALEAGGADIARQRDAVKIRDGARAESAIFGAHLLLLRDEELLEPVRRSIRMEGRTAGAAWHATIERAAAEWDRLEDPYQRARAADVRSVGQQVLARILGVPIPRPALESPGVVVAADLSPADTALLDPGTAIGIATAHGGPTSHAAVLARSLGIPAVVGAGEALLDVPEGTPLAVDGSTGVIYVDPSPEIAAEIHAAKGARDAVVARARAAAHETAATADGVLVEVSANIGSPEDAAAAVAAGADGVGLLRTEVLFMGRETMPDELEQEVAYRRAAEALEGRPIVVRTLDVGADKPLPYLRQPAEANPFLGMRGIRLGLDQPEVLETQLRALLRVAADHPLHVMFPMVATLDELLDALTVLGRAGHRPAGTQVGIMIEVPSAALVAERLAPHVDFFSIGTNDLTQYTIAADRGNERVAGLADALHPAVLRLIARTVEAADAHGRWVGVCGELAGDPEATSLLLGLGVRELSMSWPAIAIVKEAVRATRLDEARTLADVAVSCATAAEVRDRLVDRTVG